MPHSFGTGIRSGINAHALAGALAMPGNDLRYWVSHGTVCTVGDDGQINTKDANAVWIGPEGVECDVRLEPLNIHVCAQYAGISAGDVTIYPPIHQGDRVLVNLPEGFAHLPIIVAILHSRSSKQPLGQDRKPIFDNKRLLVYAKTAAIDVRNAGGVQVLIEQDGTVTTTAKKIQQGGPNLTEKEVQGTSYRQAEDTMLQQLYLAFTALQAAAVGPLAALKPGFLQAQAGIQAFQSSASGQNGFLSDTVYVK